VSQLARKPIFFILIVRPSQEDCEIDSPEEESSETASEENFSKEEPSPEKKAVTPQPHRENPLPKPKPASGGPVVNNNPLNWVDPLGFRKRGQDGLLGGSGGRILIGDIVIDSSTGHVLDAPSKVMNAMEKEYYNARVDLERGRVGAQERFQSVVEKYAKNGPAGFNRSIADAESIYQTGERYQPTTTESLAYFGKLGVAAIGTGATTAAAEAALLTSAEAVALYGPKAYAATKAAAYSGYAAGMTAAASPAAQKLIEFGYGYFGPPDPPRSIYEAAGSAVQYTWDIYQRYDFQSFKKK